MMLFKMKNVYLIYNKEEMLTPDFYLSVNHINHFNYKIIFSFDASVYSNL